MGRPEQLRTVQDECLELFIKKNHDYGDAFADFGVVGVLVRVNDKIRRTLSIVNNGIISVDNESLRDTLLDLHNYAGMAVMLMDEKNRISTK
jgi:hypothetical protein